MTDFTPRTWPEKDPAQPGEALARATDPEVRKDWSKRVGWLREQSAKADPFLYSRDLKEHKHRFEATV